MLYTNAASMFAPTYNAAKNTAIAMKTIFIVSSVAAAAGAHALRIYDTLGALRGW